MDAPRRLHPDSAAPLVALYQDEASSIDHFAGVEEALLDRGVRVDRFSRSSTLIPLDPAIRLVAVSEFHSAQSRRLLRDARAQDATTLLLMDGIVEWRNTFRNPRAGDRFLRPAPCDVVACAGPIDQRRLEAWGNIARVTGLPRLAANTSQRPRRPDFTPPGPARVLLATARNPVTDPGDRRRLRVGLQLAAAAIERAGATPIWRVAPAMARELGVANDDRPLAATLAACHAAITTVSTLMIECMQAHLPTALLWPYGSDVPCWQSASWGWPGGHREHRAFEAAVGCDRRVADLMTGRGADGLDALVASLLAPPHSALSRQRAILAQLHRSDPSPALALADLITELLETPLNNPRVRATPPPGEIIRLPRPVHRRPRPTPAPDHLAPCPSTAADMPFRRDLQSQNRMRRVVNCVVCEGSSVGGVTTWAWRLASELQRRPHLGYEAVTLLIGTSPDAIDLEAVPTWAVDTTRTCLLDPTLDPLDQLTLLRAAVEMLDPDLILPNYCDLPYMVAMQLRAASRRRLAEGDATARPLHVIACAHTDDEYYRSLIRFYDQWDGAAAVSETCLAWLQPIVEERRRRLQGSWAANAAGNLTAAPSVPLRRIVYGVPVADEATIRARFDSTPAGRTGAPHTSATRPLEVAYIGRLVQWQKRIFDFVSLIAHLEDLRTPVRLHMVGEGSDERAFRDRLRNLRQESPSRESCVEVIMHGRRTPDEVQTMLRTRIEVSVLLSEFEGTSITMLEAMGAGVVPAVTRVASGVQEWIEDGINGITVPVGRPDLMAERLAWLADHPRQRRALGEAAWRRVRDRVSVSAMADAWVELFDSVTAGTVRPDAPTDRGVRVFDQWRWQKPWSDDSTAAATQIVGMLREAGYQRIAFDRPGADSDAVVVQNPVVWPTPEDVASWQERGLGYAFAPHLLIAAPTGPLRPLAEKFAHAREAGCRRIAVYGIGQHTRRGLKAIRDALPWIVGFIDDAAPVVHPEAAPMSSMLVTASSPSSSSAVGVGDAKPTSAAVGPSGMRRGDATAVEFLGRPVLRLGDMMALLKPDAIIISSDAWEESMWRRTLPWRRKGQVRVYTLYGTYDG